MGPAGLRADLGQRPRSKASPLGLRRGASALHSSFPIHYGAAPLPPKAVGGFSELTSTELSSLSGRWLSAHQHCMDLKEQVREGAMRAKALRREPAFSQQTLVEWPPCATM